jgi:hypothetical protein
MPSETGVLTDASPLQVIVVCLVTVYFQSKPPESVVGVTLR